MSPLIQAFFCMKPLQENRISIGLAKPPIHLHWKYKFWEWIGDLAEVGVFAQKLCLLLAVCCLPGSLMQLLELLCTFHFTRGDCLLSVYNNPASPLSPRSSSLPPSLFSLFIFFFLSSLCHSVSRLASNGVVVIPGSSCATGVCVCVCGVWWVFSVAHHCPCHRCLLCSHSAPHPGRTNSYQHAQIALWSAARSPAARQHAQTCRKYMIPDLDK